MSGVRWQNGSLDEQIYTLVAFWLESMIYGLSSMNFSSQMIDLALVGAYAVLFIAATAISLRNKRAGGGFSLPFFLSTIWMFLTITLYTTISVYRGIRAYALALVPPMPVNYYHNFTMWDNLSSPFIVSFLVWHADILVIYRCYVVWDRRLSIVAVPILLLLVSIVINCITFRVFVVPGSIPRSITSVLFTMVFPVNLAQNVLTTGLISFRIWRQHRESRASGLSQSGFGMSLLTVIQIIVESAMVYTIQQLLLLILNVLRHPAQVILHATLIPSIGVVFALMTFRIHWARIKSEMSLPRSSIFRAYAVSIYFIPWPFDRSWDTKRLTDPAKF
ncbi:hypothetical protein MD484_g6186, partial [Candolleomyces efflorescens]